MNGLRGEWREGVALSDYTSWRVGGLSRYCYRPADLADLQTFLPQRPADEPLLFMGLGSNLLVRDGGFNGTTILLHGALNGLTALAPEGRLRVEAGIPSAKLSRYCAHHALAGAEFLGSIPGTVGGALAMNAGCFGCETWPLVVAVETIDRQGVIHRRQPEEFTIGYRSVQGPVAGEWFVAAELQFEVDHSAELKERGKLLWQQRSATQPTRWPNAGSVFRNPVGDYAGRLIEACGLKGLTRGAAQVSEKHANFIINLGGATARDIEAVMAEVVERVEQQFGVRLQSEVKVVGEGVNG